MHPLLSLSVLKRPYNSIPTGFAKISQNGTAGHTEFVKDICNVRF